jgi:hypothetical protein
LLQLGQTGYKHLDWGYQQSHKTTTSQQHDDVSSHLATAFDNQQPLTTSTDFTNNNHNPTFGSNESTKQDLGSDLIGQQGNNDNNPIGQPVGETSVIGGSNNNELAIGLPALDESNEEQQLHESVDERSAVDYDNHLEERIFSVQKAVLKSAWKLLRFLN